VELLDQLGVPDDAGERKAMAALKDDGQEIPRATVRDAVKVRQDRAESTRRAFFEQPPEDGAESAPTDPGAARRGRRSKA
jgi:hypothetical protein